MTIIRTRTLHRTVSRNVPIRVKTPNGGTLTRSVPVRAAIKVKIRTVKR